MRVLQKIPSLGSLHGLSLAAMILLSCCIFTSCTDDSSFNAHPKGTVVGRVFFQDTDRTIPKVVVSIGDQEYKTVTNGKFIFEQVPYGSHMIQAAKGGYTTHISEVVVDAPTVEHNVDLWYAPDD